MKSPAPIIWELLTPVTIIRTFIVLSMSGEIWAPEISFAFGEIFEPIISMTCLYSSRDMSLPPTMLTKAPVAFFISTSSKGLLIALSTASLALSCESDSPMPMRETPPLFMTAFTSAKSKLTRPDLVINSVIPLTELVRISSATLKAVWIGSSGAISRSLSFGITISVSVTAASFSRPFCAFSILFCPSTVKGKVTTPIVKAPIFFAMLAMTGEDPVPVPPPRPQVMKTKSELAIFFLSSCSDSFAACSPIFGLLPAPRPFVSSLPIRILVSTPVYSRSWASVLMAIISQPLIPISFILETELPPPPPQPITFTLADCFCSREASSSSTAWFFDASFST